MPLTGEYVPSKWDWVADQVETYERTGGAEANTLMDTGIPIVIITSMGASSGKIRKFALMQVEHEGEYAIIASKAGMPQHPGWYHNLVADPNVTIQDGAEAKAFTLRAVEGAERDEWYARGVAAYPDYANYEVSAAEHGRTIPVFVASPA